MEFYMKLYILKLTQFYDLILNYKNFFVSKVRFRFEFKITI